MLHNDRLLFFRTSSTYPAVDVEGIRCTDPYLQLATQRQTNDRNSIHFYARTKIVLKDKTRI
jgi:hypothetical protein